MKGKSKNIAVYSGLLFILFLNSHLRKSWAEEPTPEPTDINAKAALIIKSSMKVIREEEGVVSLALPGHQSLANKTLILFFRKKGSRMEVIANGSVTGEKKLPSGAEELQVALDIDTVIKYPQSGDYAVPMNDPNASAATDKKDSLDYLAPDDGGKKEPNHRPGYLEYGMGQMYGSLKTTSSTIANVDKISSGYHFGDTHLAYFSEYFPIGIEIDSHSGNFPTQTYEGKVVTSSESVSTMSLNYRFKPFANDHLAPILKISSLSDQFTTNTTDVSLLSTKISGLGFGGRLNYDLISPVWKKAKTDFFIQLQGLHAEFIYYPSVTATDGLVARGTSSNGSTAMQYRLGLDALMWVSFIPIFKRFLFEASYGARMYNLQFSGTPANEPGNPNTIAPNGTSKESEQDYRFFIGVRLDDPVKMLLGEKEKKSDETPEEKK